METPPMDALAETYHGWTIRLTPLEKGCSSFAMVLVNPAGEETHHVAAAGKTVQVALANGREMVDFEIGLAAQKKARKAMQQGRSDNG